MTKDENCSAGPGSYPSDCDITQGLRQKAAARAESDGRSYAWRACLVRAKQIKLLLLDVDGILTDGSLVFTASGEEAKTFNSQDGLGIRLVQKAGVEVGIITARQSEAVRHRARNLGLKHVYQGMSNKIEAFEQILTDLNLAPEQVAYMGDDWLDLPLLIRVGLAATVADGVREVKAVAHYICANPGGRGAVREVCELIIEAQGKFAELLLEYTGK